MEFINYIKDAWDIVTLKEKSMLDISKDKSSLTYGLIIMFAVSLLAPLVSFIMQGPTTAGYGLDFIITPLLFGIGSLVTVGIYHLFARMFGGTADFMSLYKPFLFTYILSVLLIYPLPLEFNPLFFVLAIVYSIIAIWQLVVGIFLIRAVHNISTGKAIASILIPIVIIAIITLAAVALFIFYAGGLLPAELIV